MKKLLKRILVFVLICSLLTSSLCVYEEKRAYAIAGVDDAAIVGLIIAGFSLAIGTYSYWDKSDSGKTPVDFFEDMFSVETYKNLYKYISSSDISGSNTYLSAVSESSRDLANAARKIKAQYKYPVEQLSDGTYRTYDNSGNIFTASSIAEIVEKNGITANAYYLVSSLDSCPFTVDTSGNKVLKKEIYDCISSAVAASVKKIVSASSTVLDWLDDRTKVTYTDEIAIYSYAYFEKFGADFRASISSFFGDSTFFFVESTKQAFSWNGVFLELHTDSGIYYGIFPAERFDTLTASYSETGNLSVLTGSMSANYTIYNESTFVNGKFNQVLDNTQGGKAYNVPRGKSVAISQGSSGTHLFTSSGNFAYSDAINSSNISLYNNGITGNYVIGTVAADGTISYEVVGESEEVKYTDTFVTGNKSVKVSGDVRVADSIIEAINARSMAVEDINDEIADVNDSVRALDTTMSNGFSTGNGLLASILSAILGLPSLIFEKFLGKITSIVDFLDMILSAILDIPVDIVSAVNSVKEVASDIFSDLSAVKDFLLEASFISPIVAVATSILDSVIDIPDSISSVISSVKAIPASIADALSDIGDFVVSIPDEISDTFTDIKDAVKDIPSAISIEISSVLSSLFIPSDDFFDKWKNDFFDMLYRKLQYDVYLEFIQNLKDIEHTKLEDITVNMYGKECTVVTFKWYYEHQETVFEIVRGVSYITLVFYNINNMYLIIRGKKFSDFVKESGSESES